MKYSQSATVAPCRTAYLSDMANLDPTPTSSHATELRRLHALAIGPLQRIRARHGNELPADLEEALGQVEAGLERIREALGLPEYRDVPW